MYCRVSYHDDKALTIKEKLLTNYAESNNMKVCGITSESASGTTFFVPEADSEVNSKIVSGEINYLVVKDITCLGRDMFQVDEYIQWFKK